MRLADAENAFKKWIKILVCTSPFLMTLAGPAFATDLSWTNTLGGNWNDFTNWNPNTVPGFTDNAYITNNGTYTVTLDSVATVSTLKLGGTSGGSGKQTLLITNPAVLPIIFTVSGNALVDTRGILTCSSNVTVNFSSNATVAGVFNWAGGSLGTSNSATGSLTIATNGTLNLLGAAAKTLNEAVTNNGKTVWTNGGDLYFNGSLAPPVLFINNPGAVFDVRNDQLMTFVPGGGVIQPPLGFSNGGLFRKLSGSTSGATFIQVPFANSGAIQTFAGATVFSDGLNLSSSGAVQYFISGPTPGSQYGTIAIAPPPPPPGSIPALPTLGNPGSIKLAGTLNVSLINGYAPNVGDTFTLMTFALKQSGFDAAVLGSVSNAFIEVQLPTDARSLIAVIKTTNAPPVRTNMPDQTVAVGSTANLFAPASGVVPLTYQWQFNGTNLIGQTNATLSIVSAQTNSAGSYCVTVADALLRTNTWCASLSVFPLQNFTSQPSSQTVSNGGPMILNVGVNSQLPLQYQWRCNGVNITGGAGPALTVTTNAQLWDGGNYDVLVASSVGMLISTDALVTVAGSPLPFANFPGGGINGFTNGLLFSGTGNNTGATNLPGDPPIEGNPPGHRLWLQLNIPSNSGSALAQFDTAGSSFDTVLGVFRFTDYSSSSVTNLTLLGSDDDSGKSLASRVSVLVQGSNTCFVAVDGFAGATGNVVLTCTLNTNITSLAQVDSQPQDQSVASGGTATFSASATNTPNAAYQWYKNGWLKIPGATNSTLTLTNVGHADVNNYSLAVTDTNGQALDSLRATLEIGSSLSFRKLGLLTRQFNQSNGNFFSRLRFNALSVSFPSVSAGDINQQLINNFNSLTAQGQPASTNNGIGGSSRWFLVTAATNATMQIDTMGSDIPTALEVYTNFTNTIFPPLIASDIRSAPDGHSLVRFLAVSNIAYLTRVDGTNVIQGDVNLTCRMGIPPNTVSAPQLYIVGQGANLSQFSAGENSNVTSPAYQWQCNGTNIPGATDPTYQLNNIQFNQCGSYSVVVSNLMGVVTNAIALVSVDSPLRLVAFNPAHLTGSATQAVVLQLSTNMASTTWTPLYTNPTSLLPVNYFDVDSVNRDKGFYRLKSLP
jgi:hypothetical protein